MTWSSWLPCLSLSIRGGFYYMNEFRKYGGRNTVPVLSAILIILMIGILPTVRAFSGIAHTAEFWQTSCPNLGSNIQARFEWDISGGTNNTNTMAINEVGQQNGSNVFWDFKFDEFPQGYYYAANVG